MKANANYDLWAEPMWCNPLQVKSQTSQLLSYSYGSSFLQYETEIHYINDLPTTEQHHDEKYIQVQHSNGLFSCRASSEGLHSVALGLNPSRS